MVIKLTIGFGDVSHAEIFYSVVRARILKAGFERIESFRFEDENENEI